MTDAVVLLVAFGIFFDLWLAAYVALRLRRRYVRAAFLPLAIDAILMAATYVGLDPNIRLLGPEWNAVALWSFALSHPLIALFVLLEIHDAAALRRHPYVLGLFAPIPALAVLAPVQGYSVALAYQTNWLSSYLVVCLALGLAEAIAWWRATELHRLEAFGLVLATTIAIITGPTYSFELQFLNITSGQGANPGMPLVLAVFALVAVRANALPMPTPSPATAAGGRFPAGRVSVLDEVRPKYAVLAARRAAAAGQPVLLVQRREGGDTLPVVEVPSTRYGPGCVATTLREFANVYRGGLVVLRDLGDIACGAGLHAAEELAAEAKGLARMGRIGLVVSIWGLTDAEKAALARRLGPAMKMPRPEEEIHAIIARALGSAARRIVDGYAAAQGRRREDLTPADIPGVADHLQATLADLARVLDDEPVVLGWRKEADRIALELDRFSRLTLDELAKGPWPSATVQRADVDYLVKASDYWKGKNLEDALRAGEARTASVQLGEQVRALFLESLGPAGSDLFEMELRRMQRSVRDLSSSDIRAIAEGAERAAGDLAAAIDVASGRSELEARARSLRQRLLELAGGAA